jgi:hypothetical protein
VVLVVIALLLGVLKYITARSQLYIVFYRLGWMLYKTGPPQRTEGVRSLKQVVILF